MASTASRSCRSYFAESDQRSRPQPKIFVTGLAHPTGDRLVALRDGDTRGARLLSISIVGDARRRLLGSSRLCDGRRHRRTQRHRPLRKERQGTRNIELDRLRSSRQVAAPVGCISISKLTPAGAATRHAGDATLSHARATSRWRALHARCERTPPLTAANQPLTAISYLLVCPGRDRMGGG